MIQLGLYFASTNTSKQAKQYSVLCNFLVSNSKGCVLHLYLARVSYHHPSLCPLITLQTGDPLECPQYLTEVLGPTLY